MRVNITLPDYLVEETDKRAAEAGMTRSGYIAAALHQKASYDDMFKNLPLMVQVLKDIESKIPNQEQQ